MKAAAQDALLNASYDVYREINASFAADWKARTGRSVEIRQAHAGSSVQARAVIDGLEADVVTFNKVTDLDALVEAKLVSKDWRTKYPYDASPYRSIMVFIVRHGNPRGVKNWDDLVKPGMQIALANPKTSGNGRYAYLSAYGYALALTMPVDFPVATVDPVVDRHKNRPLAERYLRFLFSEAAQEIFAKFDYRPLLPSIENKFRDHYSADGVD
jgi:ABC-type sulfate transport system substrate-binding protein